MDPIGSWSAYAASYNRLTNTNGIQNGASSELLGATNCGQGIPSTTPQLLLQAHASSTMPTASSFTPTGFLSPSPVAYDGVFTPIFHQKAHYGTYQHRTSLKQPIETDYNQYASVNSNFYEQSSGWSQGSPQLPSPFGILPHESVVTNASAKTYENVQLQGLNQHNAQINTPFVDPKKQIQLPSSKSSFFQQPVISDSSFKHSDYSSRFSYGHIHQPCSVQASVPPKEYFVSQPSRILFDQIPDKNDYGLHTKLINSQVKTIYESSERGIHLESQSSPISFAMMDTNRGFQSTKPRPQQYQIGDEQSCRFNNDLSFHRKANTTYNDNSDLVGVARRSPSAHSGSPVYPMYNSPMSSISSPSPNNHDVCYSKQSNDEALPLDVVSLPHDVVNYSSTIARLQKTFTDERYDREDLIKHQWDERQRRCTYESSNIQRAYEEPNQLCLQDLSSCRRNPLSLVKTFPQQSDKYYDERYKKCRMNEEKIQEATCNRVPPPAHLNANHQNQNSYFEFDRWNLTTGKVFSATPVTLGPPQTSSNFSSTFTEQHQQQSAALVVQHHGPPISYLPAFRLSPTQPSQIQATINDETEKEGSSTEPLQSSPPSAPSDLASATSCITAESVEVTISPTVATLSSVTTTTADVPSSKSPTPPSPSHSPIPSTSQPNIIVPDIEEELSFLTDDQLNSESETSFKKPLAPNPNSEFHATYLKFIEDKKNCSSPLNNSRPVKKTILPKLTPPSNDKPNLELKVFPSDPLDDPRYYPLPKSIERTFESSDSEYENVNSNKDEHKKGNTEIENSVNNQNDNANTKTDEIETFEIDDDSNDEGKLK